MINKSFFYFSILVLLSLNLNAQVRNEFSTFWNNEELTKKTLEEIILLDSILNNTADESTLNLDTLQKNFRCLNMNKYFMVSYVKQGNVNKTVNVFLVDSLQKEIDTIFSQGSSIHKYKEEIYRLNNIDKKGYLDLRAYELVGGSSVDHMPSKQKNNNKSDQDYYFNLIKTLLSKNQDRLKIDKLDINTYITWEKEAHLNSSHDLIEFRSTFIAFLDKKYGIRY